MTAYGIEIDRLSGSATFTVARAVAYEIMNVYAVRMAAVFTIATYTLALRTGFVSRWIAITGYASAVALFFAGRHVDWIVLVFPFWVLLFSLHILLDNFGVLALGSTSDSDGEGDTYSLRESIHVG